MFEPIVLREEDIPDVLVVVRLGARTLDDDHLHRSVAETHARWGIWGFSVLEVPDEDFHRLARMRPLVAERRQLLIANGEQLIEAGFPLLATLDAPHWTIALAASSPEQFTRVRSHFRGPVENPAYRRSRPVQ